MYHKLLPHKLQIQKYIEEGKTLREVGEIYGVTRQAVSLFVIKHFPDIQRKGICKSCGRSFPVKNNGKTLYCPDCKAKQWTAKCEYCGIEYTPSKQKGRFCSPRCASLANSKKIVVQHSDAIWAKRQNGKTVKKLAIEYEVTVSAIYQVLQKQKELENV